MRSPNAPFPQSGHLRTARRAMRTDHILALRYEPSLASHTLPALAIP
jgi:hypothetical protein